MQAAPALVGHVFSERSRVASQGGAGSATCAWPLIGRMEENDFAYNHWLHGQQVAQAGAGKLVLLPTGGNIGHSHAGSPAITEW